VKFCIFWQKDQFISIPDQRVDHIIFYSSSTWHAYCSKVNSTLPIKGEGHDQLASSQNVNGPMGRIIQVKK
jgi:hypothetical protein